MKNLYLFDVDDTLIVSNARILIWKESGEKKYISSADLREMRLSGEIHDWEVDFSGFSDPDKVRDQILGSSIGPGVPILLDRYKADPETVFGILSNRSTDESMLSRYLRQFFIKHGLPWVFDEPQLIFCTNSDEYASLKGKNGSEQKLFIIQQLEGLGEFDSITLVDDDSLHKVLIEDYYESNPSDVRVEVIQVE